METQQRKPISQMSNKEFFEAFCFWDLTDMRVAQRMVNAAMEKAGVANRPLWEKQDWYDKWMREPFDEMSYCRAKINYSQVSI